MNSILQPYLRKYILFFDDILIYSPTWKTHLQHVEIALKVLRLHQFFIKATKCAFGQHKLEYLGHIVTTQGVKVNMKKIEAIIAWPQPSNLLNYVVSWDSLGIT